MVLALIDEGVGEAITHDTTTSLELFLNCSYATIPRDVIALCAYPFRFISPGVVAHITPGAATVKPVFKGRSDERTPYDQTILSRN